MKKVKFIDDKGNTLYLDNEDGKIRLMLQNGSAEPFIYNLDRVEVPELIHELMRLKGGG